MMSHFHAVRVELSRRADPPRVFDLNQTTSEGLQLIVDG
jgi:hypothetical protein